MILLAGDRDGIIQIAEALSLRSNIDAIHIISHGEQGALSLGNAELTSETMANKYRAQLAMIGDALTENGDILVYGCDFAGGNSGHEAAQNLANITRADVAASTDLTGQSSQGGDWTLELQTGSVEAEVYKADPGWNGLLAAVVVESHDLPLAAIDVDEAISSSRSIGQTFRHTQGGSTYQVHQVELALKALNGTPLQDITVSIHDNSNGTELASGTISSAGLSSNYGWQTFTLNTVITFDQGTTYFFKVSTDNPSETVEVGAESGSNYSNGEFVQPDGNNDSSQDTLFRLLDTSVNNAPDITLSTDFFGFHQISQDEGQALVTTVTVNDPDPTDTITFSLAPAGGLNFDPDDFVIDPNTGVLSFNVIPDFENPVDTDSPPNNIYWVKVVASDGNGGSDSQIVVVHIQDINDLPVASDSSVTINENQAYSFQPSDFDFNDDENDNLVSINITFLDLKGGSLAAGGTTVTAGMEITAALGSLVFTPAPNSSETALFRFTVNDTGSGVLDAEMRINIVEINSAPVITSGMGLPDLAVISPENQLFVGQIIATDDDIPADTLTYSIIGGPDAAKFSIDPVSGVFSFITAPDFENQTDANSNGIYTVVVQVSDGRGGIDTQQIRVNITDVNDAPIAIEGSVNVIEDTPYLFAVSDFDFSDDDGDALQSVTITGLSMPAGTLTHSGGINVVNGDTLSPAQLVTLQYTPNLNSIVGAGFNFSVNDADTGSTAAMTINVTAVNDAPAITSGGGVFETDVIISENQTHANTFIAADVDLPADTLTFSIIGGSDQALFTIDPLTGVLSFLNAPDFETLLDSNLNNIYNVRVQVSDGNGGTDDQLLHVYIADVDEAPVGVDSSITINEDTPYIFALTDFGYSDQENDAIQSVTFNNLSLEGGTLVHSGGAITLTNGMTVTAAELADLTFIPALNSTTDVNFDFTVNDANLGIIPASMDIYVTAINDVPEATGGAVNTPEDTIYNFVLSDFGFTDVENDTLQSITINNLSLAGGALTTFSGLVTDGMTLTVADLATFNFIPASNSVAPASFDYTVNDANIGIVSDTMSITVLPVNDAPTITSFGGVSSIQFNMNEGATLATTIQATDSDIPADTLTYTIIGGVDAAQFSIDALTGELNFNVAPDFEAPTDAGANNSYRVHVQVADGNGGTDQINITVNVIDINEVPVATGGTVTTSEDQTYSFQPSDFNFTDAEGDGLQSITITNLNLAGGILSTSGGMITVTNGMTITSAMGTLEYSPALNSSANASFDYTVNDTGSGIVSATMAITVTAINDAPVTLNNTVSTNEDTPYTFGLADFPFADVEGDALQSITINGLSLPAGTLTHSGGVNAANGDTLSLAQLITLQYTPNLNSTVGAGFTFSVNDNDTGSTAVMTITVTPCERCAGRNWRKHFT